MEASLRAPKRTYGYQLGERVQMKDFYFLRHGQTDWNARERLQGKADIPLNEEGRKQAIRASRMVQNSSLSRPDLEVFSSPLKRAHETAKIIATQLGKEITLLDDLEERDFGLNEGFSFTESLQEWVSAPRGFDLELDGLRGRVHAENAEPFYSFCNRTLAALHHCINSTTGTPLIVSHGGVFSALCWKLFDPPRNERSENCVVYRFHYSSAEGFYKLSLVHQ